MQSNMKRNKELVRVSCTAALSLIAIFWVIPVVWIIVNSFKTNVEFQVGYANFKGRWEYLRTIFPKRLNFGSYIAVFTGEGLSTTTHITTMLKNSVIVSVARTAIVVVISSLSAYAYERLDFPVGDKIFWGLFYVSLIPNIASTLPLFKICNSLGWLNNLNALIWPGCAGIMNIFLIRNFLKGVPKEMDEAARIDGAGSFAIYRILIVPAMKPVLMIVGLSAFRGAWNDYFWPSIVMTDPKNQTLTAGLALLENALGGTQWTNMLACIIISMIFPFVLYLFCQKYFLKGIQIQAAVKG